MAIPSITPEEFFNKYPEPNEITEKARREIIYRIQTTHEQPNMILILAISGIIIVSIIALVVILAIKK